MNGSTGQDRIPDGSLETAIELTSRLIAFPSVSSVSNVDITDHCESMLSHLGFRVTRSSYTDPHGQTKSNLVAKRPAATNAGGGLAYFGHTDVVPVLDWTGAASSDQAAPDAFAAQIHGDRLYGRGACDMKGSLAAMLSAIARIDPDDQSHPIWFVCTADEEIGFYGAKHLASRCSAYRDLVASDPVSIIGEPTELAVVYAHKGIRGCKLTSNGRAGHSATGYGINANEAMVPMLNRLLELCKRTRQQNELMDKRFDPPTLSWNFGVSDHSDVINITPERSDAWVSLRNMPGIDGQDLFDEVASLAKELGLSFRDYEGCDPLWNEPDSPHVIEMQTLAGTDCKTVCYATDGGVLGELSKRVVIGPGSIDQAHTVDEYIALDQLDRGIDCYEKAIRHWCCQT